MSARHQPVAFSGRLEGGHGHAAATAVERGARPHPLAMATLGEGLCTSIAYAEAALYGLPTQRVWRTIAEYINEVTRRAFALDAGGIRLDMSGTAESGVVAVSHPRRNTTIVEIPAGLAGEMPWGEPGRALVGAIVSAAAAEAHAPQRVAQVMSDYDATPESPIFGRPFPGEGFRLG